MLVTNYLQYRRQLVKGIGTMHWLSITKDAPQGSMFGPLAYDIYSNDLLYIMSEICDIYNYANGIYVTNKMEHDTDIMLNWFNSNLMQENPNKFD